MHAVNVVCRFKILAGFIIIDEKGSSSCSLLSVTFFLERTVPVQYQVGTVPTPYSINALDFANIVNKLETGFCG
jgi:hypothetical protein